MKDIENVGLLKMDFLGLRTLTIIRDTLELIKKNHQIEIDIDNIPLNDEKTYKIFSRGQTTGVFQFESAPMREYLKKLQPTCLNDLAAMNALYRPGPMEFIDEFINRKFGRKQIEYLHKVLEEILKETYGIIVYQEQVIQIANKIGGLSLAEADILRRAMGKKDLLAMKEQKAKFIKGALENGVNKKVAEEIFKAIDKFANYGFNKSHAVAYSYIAFQTAYLKAHYTPEFLAANLTNEFENTDKVSSFLEDCRKLRIEVMPPDVNNPSVNFDVTENKIRFGMSAIKNVGKGAVEEIIKSRKKIKRDFHSIYDFCMNVDTRIVNKRALEGLVITGAFDSITNRRSSLFRAVEQALDLGHKYQNSKLTSENSLFGNIDEIKITEPELPDAKPWGERERLAREREVVGSYITGHPLDKYSIERKYFSDFKFGHTENLPDGKNIRACGIITGVRKKIDRAGNSMAFFTVNDKTGSCECLMFSKVFEKYGKNVIEEEPVLVVGEIESSGDSVKLHVSKLIPLDEAREDLTQSVKIIVRRDSVPLDNLSHLKKLFKENEGKIPVYLQLSSNGEKGTLYSLKNHRIQLSRNLMVMLIELFGENSIILSNK
jgi:DNA polymerase-3 subunit alpha